MQRYTVWVQLRDRGYAQKLIRFLNHHYGGSLDVHYAKEAIHCPPQDRGRHILITDQTEEKAEFDAFPIVMLQEYAYRKSGGKGEWINPYQSGHRIAQQLLEIMARTEGAAHGKKQGVSQCESEREYCFVAETPEEEYAPRAPIPHQNWGEGRLICVYSPIGGCGKTTFSMALAECLAAAHPEDKVLYLNLEGAADWKMFFHNRSPYNLSDFLYCMLLEDKNSDKLEGYLMELAEKQANGVLFIKPCTSFEDLNVLDTQEAEALIQLLRTYFQWIICDMNTAFHSVNQTFMKNSDGKFLLLHASAQGRLKFQDFFDSLRVQGLERDILGKSCTILPVGRGAGLPELGEYQRQVGNPLPMIEDLFQEHDGILEFKRHTDFYEMMGALAEEAVCFGSR